MSGAGRKWSGSTPEVAASAFTCNNLMGSFFKSFNLNAVAKTDGMGKPEIQIVMPFGQFVGSSIFFCFICQADQFGFEHSFSLMERLASNILKHSIFV